MDYCFSGICWCICVWHAGLEPNYPPALKSSLTYYCAISSQELINKGNMLTEILILGRITSFHIRRGRFLLSNTPEAVLTFY